MSWKLYGGKEFAENLNGLSKAMRKRALYEILKPAGEPIRVKAAATVHRLPPAPDIADNIIVATTQRSGEGRERVDEFQASVAVGAAKGFSHGKLLEYGTRHSRAFPWLRPAFDGAVSRAFGIIQEGIWAALRKANKAPSTSRLGSGGTL